MISDGKAESQEEVKPEETKDEVWDKRRQEIDQVIASTQKKAEEKYTTAIQEAKSEVETLKTQIAELKASEKKTAQEISELDPDLVDRTVILKFQKEKQEREALQQQLKEVRDQLRKQEQEKLDAQNQKEVAKLREEILSECDSRFDPKYRNDALKLADELVDAGKEKMPQTQWEGFKLMEKCYKQVQEKAAKKEPDPLPTDTGRGGIAYDDSKVKTGSLQDVLADMKKTGEWKRR